MYSVQFKTSKGWRVRNHASEVILENVTFQVSLKSRNRCLRQKRKNVHAYVVGDLITLSGGNNLIIVKVGVPEADLKLLKEQLPHKIIYNPYNNITFMEEHSGNPVYKRDLCMLNAEGCWSE